MLPVILIALYMSLDKRQREMAILRSIGVSANKITMLLVVEAAILSITGVALGLLLQYSFLFLVGPIIEANYSILVPITALTSRELFVTLSFGILGSLFGIIPAIRAYKISLNNGIMFK